MLCKRQCKQNINKSYRPIENTYKDSSDNGLFFKIHQKLLKFSNKKTNNQIKKWVKDPNRYFIKDKEMTNKHKKIMFYFLCHQRNTS